VSHSPTVAVGGAPQPSAGAPTDAHPCGAVFAGDAWQSAWTQTTIESVLNQEDALSWPPPDPARGASRSPVAVPLRLVADSPLWRGYELDAGIGPIWQRPTAHLSTLYAISNPLNQLPAADALTVITQALPHAAHWGAEALIVPNLERADLLAAVAAGLPPHGWVRLDATCRLRLPDTFEGYLQRLDKSVRTELRRGHRRASERGVTVHVRSADDAAERVAEYVALTTASATRHAIPPLYDTATLSTMLRTTGAQLLSAERQGEILAGIIAFRHEASLVLWSGGIQYAALKEFHPYTFLLHETICSSIGSGVRWIDFGRGNLKFKERRGFLPTDLWAAVYIIDPAERARRQRDLATMHCGIARFLERTP
jgi:hypothetical protein